MKAFHNTSAQRACGLTAGMALPMNEVEDEE